MLFPKITQCGRVPKVASLNTSHIVQTIPKHQCFTNTGLAKLAQMLDFVQIKKQTDQDSKNLNLGVSYSSILILSASKSNKKPKPQ